MAKGALEKNNSSIDDKIAKAHLDRYKRENKERMIEGAVDAHHAAYDSMSKYLEDKKIEHGKKIKDEATVNDILFEYVGTAIEHMHGHEDFKKKFARHNFKNESERFGKILEAAQEHLYLGQREVLTLRSAIEKNKRLKQTADAVLGEKFRSGEIIDQYNQAQYETIFNHPDLEVEARGKWFEKITKDLYKDHAYAPHKDHPTAISHLGSEQLRSLLPYLADGKAIEDELLDNYHIAKKEKKKE